MGTWLVHFVAFCGNHPISLVAWSEVAMIVTALILFIGTHLESGIMMVIGGILSPLCSFAVNAFQFGVLVHLVLYNLIPFVKMAWMAHVTTQELNLVLIQLFGFAIPFILKWLSEPISTVCHTIVDELS